MTQRMEEQRILEEFSDRFVECGAQPIINKLKNCYYDGNVQAGLALIQELKCFPEWNEYREAIDATRVSVECSQAVARYRGYMERGEDHSIEAYGVFMRVLETAPAWFLAELEAESRELGLIPVATSYLEDGTPMVSLESIAKQNGMTYAEAQEIMEKFIEAGIAEGMPVDGL